MCVCVCDIMGRRKEKEGREGKEEKKKNGKERTEKNENENRSMEEKRREGTETCSISIDHFGKILFCFCRYSV